MGGEYEIYGVDELLKTQAATSCYWGLYLRHAVVIHGMGIEALPTTAYIFHLRSICVHNMAFWPITRRDCHAPRSLPLA